MTRVQIRRESILRMLCKSGDWYTTAEVAARHTGVTRERIATDLQKLREAGLVESRRDSYGLSHRAARKEAAA